MKARPKAGSRRAQRALLVSGGLAAALLGLLMASALLLSGCSSAKHRRVLSFFFDGVPEPGAVVSATPEVQANLGRRLVGVGDHGPYAAKLCDSCHDSKVTNALVAPVEQLCVRCHELGEAKTYVHGPLASGGCTVCHDPHRSANRYLLVSASDSFCMQCHDRGDLSGVDGHGGEAADCTDCHDAHMSDRQFLLR